MGKSPVYGLPLSTHARHPNAAEFAPIRADLCRLFIEHKHDLKLDDWSDEQVIERVNDITGALMYCGTIAVQRGDVEWMERHR